MDVTKELAARPSSDLDTSRDQAPAGVCDQIINGAASAHMVNDVYQTLMMADECAPSVPCMFQLPGHHLTVNSSGQLAADVLTAAFGHLVTESAALLGMSGSRALMWRIADTADAPGITAHLPLFEALNLPDKSQYGEFQWTKDRDILLERRGNMITIFEADKNRFTTIVDNIRNLDSDFAAKPLLRFLMGLFSEKGFMVCHAALLGGAKNGMLVTGRGGMGKSTISAASVLGGAGFASDDFVALEVTPDGLIGHSVFATLMLIPQHLRNFPTLQTLAAKMPLQSPRKSMVPLAAAFPGQMRSKLKIDAIAVPQITANATSSLEGARLSFVLRALVPSSVFSSPWRTENHAQQLMDVGAACIPLTYQSGSDFSQISAPLRHRYDA